MKVEQLQWLQELNKILQFVKERLGAVYISKY